MVDYSFTFIDESGTSETTNEPQLFFGIGFFKVPTLTFLNEDLFKKIYDMQSVRKQKRKEIFKELKTSPRTLTSDELSSILTTTSHREYKFSNISYTNLQSYKEFLDLGFKYPFHFCALVINKKHPLFDEKLYKNYWNAYITHSKNLCKYNCEKNEKLIVIADYMSRPKTTTRIFEEELKTLNCVTNAVRAHSSSFPPIQFCDLLLGAVIYQWRQAVGDIKDSNRAKAKKDFLDHLLAKFSIPEGKKNNYPLAQNITLHKPVYFSVWNFDLAKKSGDV